MIGLLLCDFLVKSLLLEFYTTLHSSLVLENSHREFDYVDYFGLESS